jgi:predicted O-methyltransferase YrrM
MSEELWGDVDRYIEGVVASQDAALEAAVAASQAAGLPEIQVTPAQGKMLHLLARAIAARRILEIGTLGGYSAIWLARGLPPDGRLITLELSPEHAAVARDNLVRAGLADAVEIRVGPARVTLEAMITEGERSFDLVFIDADKAGYPSYFTLAMRLVRAGSVIVADNIVRDGAVADGTNPDPSVRGVRLLLERMAAEPRVDATVIQTVGSKGYDGFALAVVREGERP